MKTETTDLAGIARLAETELAKQVYEDGLQDSTIEAGNLLLDLTKTSRIVLKPLLTAMQGAATRLDSWLNKAAKDIPNDRLVVPEPKLLRKTLEGIATESDDSPMRNSYVQLLSRMLDDNHSATVHPAFPGILQELSALDATLLQITPYGNEMSLPGGLDPDKYCFHSGLVAGWDSWKQDDKPVGQYRFFRQVQGPARRSFGTREIIEGSYEHVGFVEINIPQDVLFRDRGVAWLNLERLRLAKEDRPVDGHDNILDLFHNDGRAQKQLESLSMSPKFVFGYKMFFRTELGKAFAKCCVPPYSSDYCWYPDQPH